MPYIERDQEGNACGYYSHFTQGIAEEWMEPEAALAALIEKHPELTLRDVSVGDSPEAGA